MAKKTKKRLSRNRTLADAPMQVTTHIPDIETEPAQAQPVDGGPTTGYRDGDDDIIETADFINGKLSEGWKDTPGKCKNVKHYDPEALVKVVTIDGKIWAVPEE